MCWLLVRVPCNSDGGVTYYLIRKGTSCAELSGGQVWEYDKRPPGKDYIYFCYFKKILKICNRRFEQLKTNVLIINWCGYVEINHRAAWPNTEPGDR